MRYLREWVNDEERAKAARQLRAEALVWAKIMVEHSPPAGRADPLAAIRQAFAEGIDDLWSGRMVDLVSFGGGATHASLRLSCSMLVGPTVQALLRRPVTGSGSAFSAPLRQAAGGRAVGPDLIVVVGTPTLTLPKQLPKGALNAKFLIGTLGGEPGPALQELASRSGGTAMALRDEGDARFLSSLLCKAFLALAASGEGHVADPAEAAGHFDADGMRATSLGIYGPYDVTRSYALGENDSPHGLAGIEYRERRHEASAGGYGHGYGSSGYSRRDYDDDFDDDF